MKDQILSGLAPWPVTWVRCDCCESQYERNYCRPLDSLSILFICKGCDEQPL